MEEKQRISVAWLKVKPAARGKPEYAGQRS
jgi:hypothetical protein